MRISKDETIAGRPAIQMRALARKIGEGMVDVSYIRRVLGVKEPTVRRVMRALASDGFVETLPRDKSPDDGEWWVLTIKGRALALASAAPPIKRATAERHLEELLERVGIVNTDPYYLYRVSKVVVFGSFLGSSERLSDLDLAMELSAKSEDSEERFRLDCDRADAARSQGKRLNIVEYYSWA